MKKLNRYYHFLLFLLGIYSLQSQTLTISSSGNSGLSSGTNWSLSGNILTVTGAANIRASVIVNALANGNLTVVGNTTNFAVTISEAITATGNNTLTVGSATNTGTITFNAVTSFAGPVLFGSLSRKWYSITSFYPSAST
jgi:glutamate synthase domain-containing protein 3